MADRGAWDSEDSSTDDSKRKRQDCTETPLFSRSKKTKRTPVKQSANTKEMEEIREFMKNINENLKEIRKENQDFKDELIALRQENSVLKEEISKLQSRVSQLETIEERLEQEDRMKRKNNVIINGLKIESSQNETMREVVKRFIEEQVKVKVNITKVIKVNNQMHVAEIESFDKKLEIMRLKGKIDTLKQNKIYISSDLTKKERAIQKTIRDRATQERSNGNTNSRNKKERERRNFTASGYHYDQSTGLYYDSNSGYYWNTSIQQYLYFDNEKMTYLLAPTTHPYVAAEVSDEEPPVKKMKIEKQSKVKVAKKIAKDMERWAKTLNQKKEMSAAKTTRS
nr:unnamed protein product [Callosobruchus chinensis]